MNENKIRNIIRECIINKLNEDAVNNSDRKYRYFYIENGDSVYDGHYLDTIECKSDKDALKYVLNDVKKVYLGNLEGDLNKKERYAIGVINPEDEDDYDIIYDILCYTKNGKSMCYSYSYFDGNSYHFFDSETEKVRNRYTAYITDFIGRTIANIPKGYCSNLTLIKKYVESFIKKQTKEDFSCMVLVYIPKKDEWKEYYATLFDNYTGEGKELYFKENND